MKRVLILSLLAVSVLSSCLYIGGKRVRGNGNWTSESRTVSAFESVEVHGAINVYVSQGSSPQVKIEADENLLQYIEVNQQGDRIVVKNRPGYNLRPTRDMKVYVTSSSFRKIDVSGACDIIGETKISNPGDLELEASGASKINMEVDAPAVKVDLSGSGSVMLKGETKVFDIEVSGAGDLKCYDLKSEKTKVRISGAGDAEVYASMELDAHVSGAGSVKYKGNATSVNQQVSGAGSVRKVE